ncbi:MAG: GerMN domain-containing protein, partial [Thermodesulfobacteriota bacterium]|nr:GerMN domain-containing protein [Thermodesulfobacteriota bacterium]
LGLEQREVERADALTGRAENAVKSLLSGPRTGLAPLFKPGVDLRQVFVDQAGTAFVDLSIQDGQGGLGAVQERLGLWALVNTLCLNFKEIKAVKVLVNGGEAPALFGHVDISRPLLPDESLIK